MNKTQHASSLPNRYALLLSIAKSLAWLLSVLVLSGLLLDTWAKAVHAGEPQEGLIAPGIPTAWSQDRAGQQGPELDGCGGAFLPSSNEEFEAEVVRLVNQIRLNEGLLPLKRVAELDHAARFHATDMGMTDYFSHTSHDRVNGTLVEACTFVDRLRSYYTPFLSLGENIAAGYRTPQAVVDAWMNSPGHRNNILSENNWEIGVGYFTGAGSYRHYWVQNFGRMHNRFPAVINGEATTTDDPTVSLHLYGSWQQVRLRTDEQAWSDWQPFAPSTQWTLEGPSGLRTVSVQMTNGSQSATASAAIHLTQDNVSYEAAELPTQITFFFDPATEEFSPGSQSLTPLRADYTHYRWVASAQAPWIDLRPSQGGAQDTMVVALDQSGVQAASDSSAIHLTIYDAQGRLLENRTIPVTVQVLGNMTERLFIPMVEGR